MGRIWTRIGLFFLGLLLCTSCTSRQSLYLKDFDALYDTVEKEYILGFTEEAKTWLGRREEFRQEIGDCRNDDEFLSKMDEILSRLGPSTHTKMITKKNYPMVYANMALASLEMDERSSMFVQWDVFQDFLSEDTRKLYGEGSGESSAQASIHEGFDTEENASEEWRASALYGRMLIDGKIGFLRLDVMKEPGAEAEGRYKKDLEELSAFAKTLRGSQALVIDIRDNPGGSDTYWLTCVLPEILGEGELVAPNHTLLREDWVRRCEKEHSPRISTANTTSLSEVSTQEFPALKTLREKGLGGEFRVNGGGEALVSPYTPKPWEEVEPFEGRIYLLVNRNTASSALHMAQVMKAAGCATLVGEPVGGSSDWYEFYRLPHTGYFYILANKEKVMQGDSLEDLVHLRPDVMVEDGRRVVWVDDHFRRDPSIRKVLQLEGLSR